MTITFLLVQVPEKAIELICKACSLARQPNDVKSCWKLFRKIMHKMLPSESDVRVRLPFNTQHSEIKITVTNNRMWKCFLHSSWNFIKLLNSDMEFMSGHVPKTNPIQSSFLRGNEIDMMFVRPNVTMRNVTS